MKLPFKKKNDVEVSLRDAEALWKTTPRGHVIGWDNMERVKGAYGHLVPTQRRVVETIVGRKKVFDLGCGNLSLSMQLLQMGAKHVVAIDRMLVETPAKKMTLVPLYFEQFVDIGDNLPTEKDVVFTSWPANLPMRGFNDLCHTAGIVIYLGKNTDGIACGNPSFFTLMQHRQVLAHYPHRDNTLIVYGKYETEIGSKKVRKQFIEEECGMTNDLPSAVIQQFNEKERTVRYKSPPGKRK